MILLPDINFDYLKIPSQLYKSIHHDEKYIKNGVEKKSTRKIFCNVLYDKFENDHIKQFLRLIKQKEVIFPQKLVEEHKLLKYLYSGEFDINKAYSILEGHYAWISNVKNFELTDKVEKMLKKGVVYLAGRDKNYRPIIVINVKLLYDDEFEEESFLKAMYTIFNICREIIFVPYYIENWILVIETAEMSLLSFPFSVLNNIITTASLQYSGTMEKIFITNPSLSFWFCWSTISTFLDEKTKQKLMILKSKEFIKLQEYIPIDQIEQKYHGSMPNIIQYWPPIDTLENIKPKQIKENLNTSYNSLSIKNEEDKSHRQPIFSDYEPRRSKSPFIKSEVEEIQNLRKNQSSKILKVNLRENLSQHSQSPKVSYKSKHDHDKANKENFSSLYKIHINEKKTLTEQLNNQNLKSRDYGFCGLCISKRKESNQLPERKLEEVPKISYCSIF